MEFYAYAKKQQLNRLNNFYDYINPLSVDQNFHNA